MSHNIEHFVYPLNVDTKRVRAELDGYVMHADYYEGCTGLYHEIRWLDKKVYANRAEAQKAIEENDRGSYDNLAVKFYDNLPLSSELIDQKARQLDSKCEELYREYATKDRKLYPATLTSALLGCKACGSRLAVNKLRSNFCPVCNKDLRPEYILKSIEAAKRKWTKSREAAVEYVDKHCKKEIKWLVKIEYHT